MHSDSKGFTMIEVLCAILLILIAANVSVLRLNERSIRIRTFARRLCSDIRYVRTKNMNSGNTALVRFEDEKDGYELKERGKVIRKVKLPSGAQIDYNSLQLIKFSITGRLKGTGSTIKVMDNNEKEEIVITIVPFSGRVLLKEDIYE